MKIKKILPSIVSITLCACILVSGQLWASSLQTSSTINHSTPKTMIQTAGSTLIESYNINPYGELDDANAKKQPEAYKIQFNQNPFIYGSGYYDTESNLQYMSARYYSAEIGRFMAQDSYDLINRYNYANANPIMFIDPDGHSPVGNLVLNVLTALIPGYGVYDAFHNDKGTVSKIASILFTTLEVVGSIYSISEIYKAGMEKGMEKGMKKGMKEGFKQANSANKFAYSQLDSKNNILLEHNRVLISENEVFRGLYVKNPQAFLAQHVNELKVLELTPDNIIEHRFYHENLTDVKYVKKLKVQKYRSKSLELIRVGIYAI